MIMRGMTGRVIRTLFGGRRGAVLILLGLIYMLIGVGFLSQPLPPAATAVIRIALDIASPHAWGVIFIVVGSVSVLNSRWATGQKIGYGLLTLLSVLWTFVYLAGYVRGVPGAYRGMLSWAALSVLILIISGWSEVPYRADEGQHE